MSDRIIVDRGGPVARYCGDRLANVAISDVGDNFVGLPGRVFVKGCRFSSRAFSCVLCVPLFAGFVLGFTILDQERNEASLREGVVPGVEGLRSLYGRFVRVGVSLDKPSSRSPGMSTTLAQRGGAADRPMI